MSEPKWTIHREKGPIPTVVPGHYYCRGNGYSGGVKMPIFPVYVNAIDPEAGTVQMNGINATLAFLDWFGPVPACEEVVI